jgi:hypothetical protein
MTRIDKKLPRLTKMSTTLDCLHKSDTDTLNMTFWTHIGTATKSDTFLGTLLERVATHSVAGLLNTHLIA